MKPQGNGIVELHDSKQTERGFGCMKLIEYLTEDAVKDWDEWHGAHLRAAAGQCPYTERCPIHARSVEKALNNPRKPLQLTLF
jgi:hypothetical protein